MPNPALDRRHCSRFFSGNILRFFIIPEGDETCMPQVKVGGPFDELIDRQEQASAIGIHSSWQPLIPGPIVHFFSRKIIERTFRDLQRTKAFRQLDSDRRRKAISRTSGIEQPAFFS